MRLIWLLLLFPLILIEPGDSSINYLKHAAIIIKKKVESVLEESAHNTDCASHVRILMQDLIKRKKWALEMADASAKLGAGLLAGNINQIGNYDQCLGIKEVKMNTTITGQYCTVMILPKLNVNTSEKFFIDTVSIANFIGLKGMRYFQNKSVLDIIKVTYGICLPSSCSIENLEAIWKYIDFTFSPSLSIEFRDTYCDHKDKPLINFGIENYIFFSFLLYGSVLAATTIYDLYFYEEVEDSIGSYIVLLSMLRNSKKLFACTAGDDNISCINGMKVLSMLWIIMGHRFLINAFSPNVNSVYLFEWRTHIENMVVVGAPVSVDTFLALSGLLLSYVYLRYTVIKSVKVNMVSFYLLRVCRLTPALLATILIYIALLKYVNDGPAWPVITTKLASDCIKYGWTNLLYINNILKMEHQCLPQTWYLAVDSQLYFLFPIIFFSIMKNSRRTLFSILAAGLASTAYTFYISMKYGYGANLMEASSTYISEMYQSTIVRLPNWLIGVVSGYYIFIYKDKEWKISKSLNVFLWISSTILLSGIVLGQIVFSTNEYSPIRSALFNAFARPIWCIVICWVVFACVTGNGGYINEFLSLPIFNFLAKLTYSTFLTHLMIILIMAGRRRHVDHFNNLRAIHEFCGDVVFSFLVATSFSLLFESPIIALGKKIFKKFEEENNEDEGKEAVQVLKCIFWIFPLQVKINQKME